jgi:hypothetical protein
MLTLAIRVAINTRPMLTTQYLCYLCGSILFVIGSLIGLIIHLRG